jgi:hypothetical protein
MSVGAITDRRRSEKRAALTALALVGVLAACSSKPACKAASDCPAESGKIAACDNGTCDYTAVQPCSASTTCPPGTSCQTNPIDGKQECLPQPTCQNDLGCASGQVCRNAVCTQVTCANDLECELGEICRNGVCDLNGCRSGADCAAGEKCDTTSHACVACLVNADCPPARPTCSAGQCIMCQSDADCGGSLPPFCQKTLGTCVDCLTDSDCAPGLSCSSSDNACHGVAPGGTCEAFPPSPTSCQVNSDCKVPAYPVCLSNVCGQAATCDVNGLCVGFTTGTGTTTYTCQTQCNPYDSNACPAGQGCGFLSSAPGQDAFVFGVPLGACIAQPSGAAGYDQACGGNTNCLYGLDCIPASASTGICRKLCDPAVAAKCDGGSCAGCDADAGEACNLVYVGSAAGENIGVCYPPSNLFQLCTSDKDCGPGFGCGVGTVPPGPPLDPDYSGWGNRCLYAPGTKSALTACNTNTDCTSGICIDRGSPPTGMFCYGACASNADCPGGTCESWQFTANVGGSQVTFEVNGCRGDLCLSNADCPSPPDGGTPLTVCNVEPDPADETSSLVLRCEPPVGSAATGAPCTANTDCQSGLCFAAPVDGGSVNICWGACDVALPTPCPSGLQCLYGAVNFTAADGITQVPETACVP